MKTIRTEREFKRKCRQGIPILMFHKIGNYPASANMPWLYVSPAHFERLLDTFERKNYQAVSLSDAVQAKTGRGNRFVISFDDGYEGTLSYAAPKLRERGFAAIQFLVASRLGQRNEWDLGVDTTMERLMSETQVQEWLSLGFEIGAHTLTHPRLSAIPISEARNEIACSKKRLEDRFGVQVKDFAYPYGNYNEAVVDLVREAGFETACTCDPGVVHPGEDALRLGRFLTDERSLSSSSSYKLCYALDDLKSVTRPGRQAVKQFIGRAYRYAFPRGN
ncbi:MAG: polysaccharide deacetylase family protein [Verrucomicrobia bacterium]|nr:polysaccharide deacetylase family protein [Verrucomicrobiota bacterium]